MNLYKTQHTIVLLKQVLYTLLIIVVCLVPFNGEAQQLTTAIDTATVTVGEEIMYEVEVNTDTTNVVIFPDGQTFSPLEMIASYPIDTTKQNATYKLIKKYGLTQFDSGRYTIPRQKIIIGNKEAFTDSLQVVVNAIQVDSTKQGLYDIKPLIEVEKPTFNKWLYTFIILAVLVIIGALLYWFFLRKKPLTEAEKIALLPPYERAKHALKKLDESDYLNKDDLKTYYSELTFAIRKYLDDKVYDHAMESTTDELISHLKLLKAGNQIDLSNETIRNIESVFKRADLVKFAKSSPDKTLAVFDRKTVDQEIDHVKEVLPEPTEEEKLLDKKYKEEQARQKKRRKTKLVLTVIAGLIIVTYLSFGFKYSFGYVNDTLLGNDNLELLKGQWITSDYGVPPVNVSTPEVLMRLKLDAENKQNVSTTTFGYGQITDAFNITVSTSVYQDTTQQSLQQQPNQNTEPQSLIDLQAIIDDNITVLENKGAKNLLVKTEKYTTLSGSEGLKVYGTGEFPADNGKRLRDGHYVMLFFTTESVAQQIVITWKDNDEYAAQIAKRIIDSVELKKEY